MDKLFTMCTIWIEEREYKKIISISSIAISLIAPSISMIFLYKRDLFLNLDIFRLMIICLILNVMIFAILYSFTSAKIYTKELVNTMKLKLELQKETQEIKKEIEEMRQVEHSISKDEYQELSKKINNIGHRYDKCSENIKEVNIGGRILFETITDIIGFTLLVWGLYVNDIIFNITLSNDAKIKRTVMYFAIIVGWKIICFFYILANKMAFEYRHKSDSIV